MRRSASGKGENRGAGGSGGATASQTSWLNISLDAALGFRAGVFQVQRQNNDGGKGGKKSSSSAASSSSSSTGGLCGGASSIAVHPQAAPVVCRHTLEVLISLAKNFPIHFLPGSRAKEAKEAGGSDGEGTRPKKEKTIDFWDTLLKLDKECWSSRKGKSVVRSHSSVSMKETTDGEGDVSGTALGISAFGQLLGMLSCPVIKRSSLLTDKLLRLLSLISLGQPDVVKKTTTAIEDKGEGEAGSSGAATETVTPVKETQIALAVEVLTSKACSEEGLEDVTALLLNLSYGGTQTRESILHLLLAGARQLGNVVSSHVSDLLTELAELKSSGGLAGQTKEEEEEGKHKGVMSDRFTKEAVVLTAPTKPKGGGELQLSSMTALTNKTSSQSFFLRVLKVIIQLREAALLAIKKAAKAKKELEIQKKADSIPLFPVFQEAAPSTEQEEKSKETTEEAPAST